MFTPVLIAGCVLLGAADAPRLEQSVPVVRRLVRRLDAPRLADRDSAEAELVKLGPDILDLLPEVNERTPAEVKQRLSRIRHKLELTLAEQTARASRVTLRGSQMPVAEVVAAMQKQTGNKIEWPEGAPEDVRLQKLDVTFDKTPFWQALDQVLDKTGLTVYPYGEGPAIHLVPRPETHVPRAQGTAYSGLFRIAPLRVVARRELRETMGDNLQVTLEASWEPRVTPIVLKHPMGAVRAVDQRGNPLKVDSEEAEFEMVVDPGETATELVVSLKLPPRDVAKIASLKGAITAVLPGKIQTFRFKNLGEADHVRRRKAGVTVTLEKTRKTNEIWEVHVRVRFDEAGDALDSHRGWILTNEARLEDADGKPVDNAGLETTHRTEKEIGIAYFFELEQPISKYTFVYKTPGLLISKDFAYEIKDIELP